MSISNFYKIGIPIGLCCSQYIISKKTNDLQYNLLKNFENKLLLSIFNGTIYLTNAVIYTMLCPSKDIYIDSFFVLTSSFIMMFGMLRLSMQ